MNIPKLLKVAGIGCGKDCRCAKAFAESMSPAQAEVLAHMVDMGAKKKRKQIKKIISAAEQESSAAAEPAYAGELTENQGAVLAHYEGAERTVREAALRRMIAQTGGDPKRVLIGRTAAGDLAGMVIPDDPDIPELVKDVLAASFHELMGSLSGSPMPHPRH